MDEVGPGVVYRGVEKMVEKMVEGMLGMVGR